MKTLGLRLALLSSLVSTATLFAVLMGGFYFLNHQLVHGIDLETEAECDRIKQIIGPGSEGFSAARLEDQLSEVTKSGLPTFFVQICRPPGTVVFRSSNLHQKLTDDGNRDSFSITLPDVGALRGHRILFGDGEIIVVTSAASIYQLMEGYAQISVILLALILLISLVAGFFLSAMALHPLRVIQETAHRIRSDNLSERIPVADVEDEISDLAGLLNEMFDRLESSFQEVRRFTAEASHELKTPLSIARLQGEKLLKDGGLTVAQENLVQDQLEELVRLNQIIEQLLFLSKAEANVIRPNSVFTDPTHYVEASIDDARILAEHGSVRFEEDIRGHLPVAFDPIWLRQILLNLVSNAIKASPKGGLVTLASDYTMDSWIVIVEDEGPGVPAEQRERIFERFVKLSTNVVGDSEGTGLGLAICRSMIEMQYGSIKAEAGTRKSGLRIVCKFPLVEAPVSRSLVPSNIPLRISPHIGGAHVPD